MLFLSLSALPLNLNTSRSYHHSALTCTLVSDLNIDQLLLVDDLERLISGPSISDEMIISGNEDTPETPSSGPNCHRVRRARVHCR